MNGIARRIALGTLASVLAVFPAARAAAAESAPPSAPLVLTLEEALEIAAQNNRDIQRAVEFRNKVLGRYVEERAAVLPQVTVGASAARSRDETQAVFGVAPQNETIEAHADLSQVLFTWGQIGAAIRAAKVGLATADDQLRVFRHAAFRDVSTAFYDVLLARELNAIAVRSEEQKGRLLDEARKKHAAGTATDYDVLAAEVARDNTRPEVIRTHNLIRSARERLRFLLGGSTREVDVRGGLDVGAGAVPTYDEALELARRRRPEISDVRHRKEISKELVTIARAGDKPRLDVRAGLGWKSLETGPVDADGKEWSAGLFASWPLFDGFRTRGRVAQAGSDLATLRIEEARLLESIALEVRDTVNAVREAGEIVGALSGTVAQAERLLQMAEKGYEFGVKTKLEVDDAQLNVSLARGNLARAHRDYLVARVTLEQVTGTLGEDRSGASQGAAPWRPAESPIGIVKEVLTGEPGLAK